jgi:hypothetical protein
MPAPQNFAARLLDAMGQATALLSNPVTAVFKTSHWACKPTHTAPRNIPWNENRNTSPKKGNIFPLARPSCLNGGPSRLRGSWPCLQPLI